MPPTFRKDLWTPLCVLNFPNQYQGLHAYARLREFRERHETEWPVEDFTIQKGPQFGQLMSRKERSFKLMDQKANSIADMAAVLAMQARPPDPALVERMARQVFTKTWTYGKTLPSGEKTTVSVLRRHFARAKRGQNSKIGHRAFEFEGNINGTSVWWADSNDAEYAETWPAEVVHGTLDVVRGHPIWPPSAKYLTNTAEDLSTENTQASQELSIEQKIEMARERAKKDSEVTSQRVTASSISRNASPSIPQNASPSVEQSATV